MRFPSFCHVRLPNAGLGNKLLVWAKAHMFAQLNQIPLVVSGWTQLHFTPLIRSGDPRLYLNYFKRIDDVGLVVRWASIRHSHVIREPDVSRIDMPREGLVYEFSAVPHWSDCFGQIRAYRDQVRQALLDMLTPARTDELMTCHPPPLCVQVRLGDFRKLRPGEEFSKVGGVRTPLAYFVNLINAIRDVCGSVVPAEIVTDGSASELSELTALPNVAMASGRSAIVDILAMSRSRVLLTSAGSTFGYWGGFLGECAMVHHPDHVHAPVRPQHLNDRYFEGSLPGHPSHWPDLFCKNIRGMTAGKVAVKSA